MSSDIRDLISRMADALDRLQRHLADDCRQVHPLAVEARATLARWAPAPVAVPVAVAERPWEREGWCDEQGYCWFFSPRFNTWSWERPPVALTRGVGRFLSLPAHAIPLPQAGEGEES